MFLQLIFFFSFSFFVLISAIAEDYKSKGNDECNKKAFTSAIHFYTEGIKVECRDEGLNAQLYNNRAKAHFCLGKVLSLKAML